MHLSADLHLKSGKKGVPVLVKTFFLFGRYLICSPEKNRGRGSLPPMMKIWQNWGKIANYPPPPPQCSTEIGTPATVVSVRKGIITEQVGYVPYRFVSVTSKIANLKKSQLQTINEILVQTLQT